MDSRELQYFSTHGTLQGYPNELQYCWDMLRTLTLTQIKGLAFMAHGVGLIPSGLTLKRLAAKGFVRLVDGVWELTPYWKNNADSIGKG